MLIVASPSHRCILHLPPRLSAPPGHLSRAAGGVHPAGFVQDAASPPGDESGRSRAARGEQGRQSLVQPYLLCLLSVPGGNVDLAGVCPIETLELVQQLLIHVLLQLFPEMQIIHSPCILPLLSVRRASGFDQFCFCRPLVSCSRSSKTMTRLSGTEFPGVDST